ncbi:MAG: chorismate-binding protein [Conchiformibius sp.]|nr:chorismate-binding protein [Conchiformibius sp.]
MEYMVLFDDAAAGKAVLLDGFVRADTLSAQDLPQLDAYLARGWQNGLHTALFADYEFGLPLQKLPEQPVSGSLQLLWFSRKTVMGDATDWLDAHGGNGLTAISVPQPDIDEARYLRDVAAVQAAIARGDTYQINYTQRLHMQAYGDPVRLYRRLRQNVPYAALARLPDADGRQRWLLCFSPELFLRINADGTLTTEPMKGTAPRLQDGRDAERAAALQRDPKNRAENTMIVDLLRNDLGKLAVTGGVSVPEPFKVSAFGSVWQMTSTVRAQMRAGVTAADIFQAAFPCGSITGAPKRKSMEYIAALEHAPRGIYTGSIGFLAPAPTTPLGFSGCLNVVIRTLSLEGSDGVWQGVYGVGSGIVSDSVAADEYTECGWKARFISELRPECGLFETLRAENGTIPLRRQHLQRLAASAQALNIPFDDHAAQQCLDAVLNQTDRRPQRIRLSLSPTGSLKAEAAVLEALPQPVKVIWAQTVLPDRDRLRRYKTDRRAVYDGAWQAAVAQGAFDALLFNQSGLLLEGGRSSVMVRVDGEWLTPALDLDILDGIARREALAAGGVREAHITRAMLARADGLRVGNALRGWLEAQLV